MGVHRLLNNDNNTFDADDADELEKSIFTISIERAVKEYDAAQHSLLLLADTQEELKEWQDYFGCESPHDTYVLRANGFARQLGIEQARANTANNSIDRYKAAYDEAISALQNADELRADYNRAIVALREVNRYELPKKVMDMCDAVLAKAGLGEGMSL